MRKLLLILLLLLPINVKAEITYLDHGIFSIPYGEERFKDFVIETYCIDGYKFVVTGGRGISFTNRYSDDSPISESMALSVTQFFEEKDGKSLPTKCVGGKPGDK